MLGGAEARSPAGKEPSKGAPLESDAILWLDPTHKWPLISTVTSVLLLPHLPHSPVAPTAFQLTHCTTPLPVLCAARAAADLSDFHGFFR